MKMQNDRKKYLLSLLMVLVITIGYAKDIPMPKAPPPPPSEKLPLGNLWILLAGGLYYGYKKLNK